MSAWGYNPFESDDSLDWLHKVLKPVIKVLKQKPSRDNGEYGPQRMAIELIIRLDKSELQYETEILYGAILWLNTMATDNEFLECWGSKAGILLEILRQKNAILDKIIQLESMR